jgi:hypothetical protein
MTLTCCIPLAAMASQVVEDQSHLTFPTNSAIPANFGADAAQVFTPSRDGLLASVDLSVNKVVGTTSPLLVTIARVINGSPDFSPSGSIATRTVPANVVNDMPVTSDLGEFNLSVSFLSDHISVSVGSPLAIILRSDQAAPRYYLWFNGDGSGNFIYDRINDTVHKPPFSSNFRTFVQIPEPSALALIAAPLLASSLIRRHV